MRSLFGFLLSVLGFVFLFGAVGLGVYLGGFTPDGVSEQAGLALVFASVVGFFSLLCGYSIFDDLAKEKRGAKAIADPEDDEEASLDEEASCGHDSCETSCDESHDTRPAH